MLDELVQLGAQVRRHQALRHLPAQREQRTPGDGVARLDGAGLDEARDRVVPARRGKAAREHLRGVAVEALARLRLRRLLGAPGRVVVGARAEAEQAVALGPVLQRRRLQEGDGAAPPARRARVGRQRDRLRAQPARARLERARRVGALEEAALRVVVQLVLVQVLALA